MSGGSEVPIRSVAGGTMSFGDDRKELAGRGDRASSSSSRFFQRVQCERISRPRDRVLSVSSPAKSGSILDEQSPTTDSSLDERRGALVVDLSRDLRSTYDDFPSTSVSEPTRFPWTAAYPLDCNEVGACVRSVSTCRRVVSAPGDAKGCQSPHLDDALTFLAVANGRVDRVLRDTNFDDLALPYLERLNEVDSSFFGCCFTVPRNNSEM